MIKRRSLHVTRLQKSHVSHICHVRGRSANIFRIHIFIEEYHTIRNTALENISVSFEKKGNGMKGIIVRSFDKAELVDARYVLVDHGLCTFHARFVRMILEAAERLIWTQSLISTRA